VRDRRQGKRLAGRAVDADAEDREFGKTTPEAAGEPHARARRRFEQEEIGLLAVNPLTGADRAMAEAPAEELEQRPGCRIRIDDEDGRHASNVGRGGGKRGCPWYEDGMNGTRVLVVDDDDDIRRLVRTLLERAGATVHDAANGRDGLREFHAARPDLVVLDVNMPGLDGWNVLERIRDMSDVPVLMLTARGEELERVRGLQSGADDYVVKPFGKQELVARAQALLRRASRGGGEDEAGSYADEYLSVDWAQARVSVGDREVQLTPLEFRLLSTFVRHPRQVLSREQLLELVWGDSFGVGGDQVKLYVGYLRRKLEPDAPDSVPIETVRGFGYRYKAPAA
jgi:DNA-binding response OmpR family regulator